MNITSYLVVSLILLSLIVIYYYLQKPKATDIYKTYSQYLLRTPNPDVAFTYKYIGNGQYENYYVNYDPDVSDVIKKEINDYPVDGTGAKYTPNEHGTLIENDKGFIISGIDTQFECPDNWNWDTDAKVCKVNPICKNEDVNMFKGIDYYHFNLNSVRSKLSNQPQQLLQEDSVKYHDRLYVSCMENGTFTIEECQYNMLFNQLESQPNTSNPCVLYDICEDLKEYTIHKSDIGNGVVLNDNEYYICINSKSELRTCKDNSVFNVEVNGCVENNQCASQETGYTFPKNDSSYIMCNGGSEFTINCINGIYEGLGVNNLECNIDKSKTYFEFFSNEYLVMPIGMYIYKNNVQGIFQANPGTFTRHIPLAPDSSGFFKNERNLELYPLCEFNTEFVQYEDETTKEVGLSIPLDFNNYKDFVIKSIIPVSYYQDSLNNFNWNTLEDRPLLRLTDSYYRYDTKIKHKNNADVNLDAVEYFYFNYARVIYKPNTLYLSEVSDDVTSGILHYADFTIPSTVVVQNTLFTVALANLYCSVQSDGRYLVCFINPFDLTLVALIWDKSMITSEVLDENSLLLGITQSKLFNYSNMQLTNTRTFHIRLSSISWYGDTSIDDNYVLPYMLLMIAFSDYSQLDKKFAIINSIPIRPKIKLQQFIKQSESLYIPNSNLTGDYNYLLNIQQEINRRLLISYE